jgi:hypothetical protein
MHHHLQFVALRVLFVTIILEIDVKLIFQEQVANNCALQSIGGKHYALSRHEHQAIDPQHLCMIQQAQLRHTGLHFPISCYTQIVNFIALP